MELESSHNQPDPIAPPAVSLEAGPANAQPEDPTSRIELHESFHSGALPDDRNIIVYLPPGYDESETSTHPVLYMHDGQNLFDPATSFVPGRTWRMRENGDALILAGEIEPLIVVGIYNTPRRMEEYTHASERKLPGGEADLYGRMIVHELKPFIDSLYRTRPEAENTGMAGSSLGGLATLYLGLQHADTFGKLAVMSPSVWWNYKSILSYANEYEGPPWPKIWLDVGDSEGSRTVPDADLLFKRLIANGWKRDVNLHYRVVSGGTHDEAAWASRVADMLRFLFPSHSK